MRKRHVLERERVRFLVANADEPHHGLLEHAIRMRLRGRDMGLRVELLQDADLARSR